MCERINNEVFAFYQNPEEAMKYLRVCEEKKIFGAVMDLVRLEYQQDKRMDLVKRLTDLLEIFPQKRTRCQLLSQLSSYHLLISTKVDEACSFAAKVMLLDPDCMDMIVSSAINLSVRSSRPFQLKP